MNSASANTWVLAIDGGGTRCRFALARVAAQLTTQLTDHGEQRSSASHPSTIVFEGGPANATTNFDATVECINEGLRSLAGLAEIKIEALYKLPAFIGLAGVTSTKIATRLNTSLPLQHARYCEDRVAALRGAIGEKNGLVAHCGTGSFFASQINGTQRFAGGWGSVLGDQASAQWVGRKALAATLQQADKFRPATALVNNVLQRFLNTDKIIEFAATATPEDFGTLAPAVTKHANNGDTTAQQIMQSGADYLSNSIDQMGWHAGLPICLTGGIGPHYQPYLPGDKANALTAPNGEPLDGALQLALAQREHLHGYR